MHRFFIASLFSLTCFYAQAQYTETINSNRPGGSQGAFAVGNQVLQLETGPQFGNNTHDLLGTDTDLLGLDYELRFGFFMEQLEFNLKGTFLSTTQHIDVGGVEQEYKYSNFQSNTLGLKYLIYDPYKKRSLEKPSIYSWKANNTFTFKWRDLIPAVSVYAGANILFGDNPYLAPNESNISPQAALITQNNWGHFVFVMNFIADKVTGDDPTYSGIFTMTHSINGRVSVFGEYQAIKSDLYADDIARAGGAYLITKDLQVDVSGLLNFKNTPSRWQVALGVSYRLDMHAEDEIIMSTDKTKDKKEKKKKKDEKENSELVNPDGTMNE
ncbi:transporter [Mesonia sp.]|uniref:transporter n=1 Tax=Mesonia sp. TaxID=1960830 RepID=UPI003F9A2A91